MKKILMLVLTLAFAFGCDTGRVNSTNPYIPNYPVSWQINLSLPAYSNLQFPSNHIVDYSYGARGIVVFNTGSSYVAYDLACPNQTFASCTSSMTINGIEAKCSCDNSVYSLFTGLGAGQQYPMKQYNVQVGGGTITVYN